MSAFSVVAFVLSKTANRAFDYDGEDLMKAYKFKIEIKCLGGLEASQAQGAEARITETLRRTEAIAEIEGRGRAICRCPHC